MESKDGKKYEKKWLPPGAPTARSEIPSLLKSATANEVPKSEPAEIGFGSTLLSMMEGILAGRLPFSSKI